MADTNVLLDIDVTDPTYGTLAGFGSRLDALLNKPKVPADDNEVAVLTGGKEMTTYNKQVASQLAEELVETAKLIADSVKRGPEESEMLDLTCVLLGRILSELRTTIRT